MIEEYTCGLTGLFADERDLIFVDDETSDTFGSAPLGWVRVTFSQRTLNPAWVDVQSAKRDMLAISRAQTLQQLQAMGEQNPTLPPEQETFLRVSVDAQYAALEARTAQFTVVERTAWVAPPSHPEIKAALNEILATLNITNLDGD